LKSTFGAASSEIVVEPRNFFFRYRSAQHFLDLFRTSYGPVLKAFEMLEEPGRNALAEDILELAGCFNASGDMTMVVPGEYLEVVVTKR
jgi:hypothetical protein